MQWFGIHTYMIPMNAVDYVILISDVVRGYWRSKVVKRGKNWKLLTGIQFFVDILIWYH